MDIEEYFGDRENCLTELSVIRERWGLKTTTSEQWEAMSKVMGLMLIYGPPELENDIQSHFDQLHQRKDYVENA